MKKLFILLIAAFACSFVFGQIRNIKSPNEKIKISTNNLEKSGWYGSTATVDSYYPIESGKEIIIRPENFLGYTIGDTITQIKFMTYTVASGTYASYTNNSFTIKIYEGVDFTPIATNGYATDISSCIGTTASTTSYTSPTVGEQIVTLSTPYEVTSSAFWISIVMNGPTLVLFQSQVINENVPLANFNYQGFSSNNNNYLYTDTYEGTDYINSNYNAGYSDATETTIDEISINFYFAYFVKDAAVYVPTSDIRAVWATPAGGTSITPYQLLDTTILLSDSIEVAAYFKNLGPDPMTLTQTLSFSLTANGTELIPSANQTYTVQAFLDLFEGGLTLSDLNTYFIGFPFLPSTINSGVFALIGLDSVPVVTFIFSVNYTGNTDPTGNNSATLIIRREILTAIADNNKISKLSIYPNPSNGLVNVLSNENGNAIVYDVTGKLVKEFRVNAGENTSVNLTAGMYFVKVNNQIEKIIVE
ncbi:MAG: T9SS type A sorting domain-containing protein [Bacteroidales bacterium]|jgi:hypothetical protein|nr:T9SS type A sorting domain-containing protein [Bacteroidales bacterium]